MKIAVLGGGFTGLTAAYYLRKKGHDVVILEREELLGGLAAGFRSKGWYWPLERAYHHLFANDTDIMTFAKEIGFDRFIFHSPETSSLYQVKQNYRTFPVDSPQGLLKFPLMSFVAKFRTGLLVLFMKFLPFFRFYEKQTAQDFLQKYGGKEAWRVLWEPLFRKKFGKFAGKVVASFIWARVNKRTKQLVYIQEGFQTLVNHMEKVDTMRGVTILKGYTVESIKKRKEQFAVKYAKNGEKESTTDIFDAVISTLPTAIMSKVTDQLLPSHYLEQFSKLQYMHAVNLILETKEPILNKTYWLSNCVKEFPFLVVVQHTNMVDKLHYGGKHIAYIGNYLDADDPLLKMDKQQTLDIFLPELEKIAGKKIEVTQSFHFKAGFAQPIFDKVFVKNKPTFTTPVKNFFIANLDMTYPYDRGTNYAVKLGKQVASFI